MRQTEIIRSVGDLQGHELVLTDTVGNPWERRGVLTDAARSSIAATASLCAACVQTWASAGNNAVLKTQMLLCFSVAKGGGGEGGWYRGLGAEFEK